MRYKEFIFIHVGMEHDKDERNSEKETDDNEEEEEEEFLPGFASFQDYSKV